MRKKAKQESSGKNISQYRNPEERQGNRFLFVWVPVIIVVILFFYILVFDPPRQVGQPIQGTSSVNKQAPLGESNGNAYMVVLDDGRRVTIEGSLMEPLKTGRRVLVQENVTLVFKRNYFSIVRYLE